jgi:hypothetical protein
MSHKLHKVPSQSDFLKTSSIWVLKNPDFYVDLGSEGILYIGKVHRKKVGPKKQCILGTDFWNYLFSVHFLEILHQVSSWHKIPNILNPS